jgi:hypothetical protein
MRNIISIVVITLIVLIFAFTVLNSKRDIYNLNKQFYSENFNSEVVKIEDGRGTKIFYNSHDFFYTDFCSNSLILERNIKIGDVVKKQDSLLEIFRRNNKKQFVKILSTSIEKPTNNYFSFFFK